MFAPVLCHCIPVTFRVALSDKNKDCPTKSEIDHNKMKSVIQDMGKIIIIILYFYTNIMLRRQRQHILVFCIYFITLVCVPMFIDFWGISCLILCI